MAPLPWILRIAIGAHAASSVSEIEPSFKNLDVHGLRQALSSGGVDSMMDLLKAVPTSSGDGIPKTTDEDGNEVYDLTHVQSGGSNKELVAAKQSSEAEKEIMRAAKQSSEVEKEIMSAYVVGDNEITPTPLIQGGAAKSADAVHANYKAVHESHKAAHENHHFAVHGNHKEGMHSAHLRASRERRRSHGKETARRRSRSEEQEATADSSSKEIATLVNGLRGVRDAIGELIDHSGESAHPRSSAEKQSTAASAPPTIYSKAYQEAVGKVSALQHENWKLESELHEQANETKKLVENLTKNLEAKSRDREANLEALLNAQANKTEKLEFLLQAQNMANQKLEKQIMAQNQELVQLEAWENEDRSNISLWGGRLDAVGKANVQDEQRLTNVVKAIRLMAAEQSKQAD